MATKRPKPALCSQPHGGYISTSPFQQDLLKRFHQGRGHRRLGMKSLATTPDRVSSPRCVGYHLVAQGRLPAFRSLLVFCILTPSVLLPRRLFTIHDPPPTISRSRKPPHSPRLVRTTLPRGYRERPRHSPTLELPLVRLYSLPIYLASRRFGPTILVYPKFDYNFSPVFLLNNLFEASSPTLRSRSNTSPSVGPLLPFLASN